MSIEQNLPNFFHSFFCQVLLCFIFIQANESVGGGVEADEISVNHSNEWNRLRLIL